MKSEDFDQVGPIVYLEKKRVSGNGSKPLFWAIASGKGGVGRSFFTSSMAITLSRQGYRVLIVDLDQNGGNLHSWMGTLVKNKNLSDYYRGTDSVKNYITTLDHEKLCLIAGDTCQWNDPENYKRDVSDLIADLKSQPFDIVLFDLSAGCDETHKDVLLKVDETFLMTTPEATSIEKTYRWIENYIMKVVLNAEDARQLSEFNRRRRLAEPEGKASLYVVRNFLEELRKKNEDESIPFGPIKLIINQARNYEDDRLGEPIRSICNKYYFLDIQAIGAIQYDNAVWQCSRQRVPVLIHQPFNPLVGQIQAVVKQLVDQTSQRAVV